MNTIDKKYCVTCKSEEDLHKYTYHINFDGDKVQYYMCNTCNNIRRKKWYYDGNQEQSQMYNKRYKMKKKGL